MDKVEALRRFVRENAIRLTSSSATSEVIKQLRVDFFNKHNLRSSERFRNSDVAEQAALIFLRRRPPSREAFISEVSRIPLVRDELPEESLSTMYDAKVSAAESILTPTDLSKMQQQEYLHSLENQFQEIARSKAEEELQRERGELEALRKDLNREREELTKFRSELDQVPPDISLKDLIEKVEAPGQESKEPSSTPWWKDIGLEGDPFPSNQGLTGIPLEKYDDVVVQTPFFKHYLDAARKAPDALLGKTILIVGEYGSGKTTLFQYLATCVADSRILPVNVILNPHPSVANLTSSMLGQLTSDLSESYAARFDYDPRRDILAKDQYLFAADLFKELQTKGITDGFLVLVDGLHKGSTYLEPVLEFLQQIQNVQEFFDRHGIRIGFLIAASPLWEKELVRIPSLSGSFYRKDGIPALTEDAAIEAVERRIRSFVSDLSRAPRIRRDNLRLAFKLLSERLPRPLTFRDFLDHVRERLESRNYEEVGLSVALHLETVDAVHGFLQQTKISRNYLALWNEIRQEPMLRSACQKTLLEIVLRRGISERDMVFKKNHGALYLLRKHRLIVQRKFGPDWFKWTLSPDFLDSLLFISRKLGIPLDVVVRAAFEEEAAAKAAEAERIYGGPLATLSELVNAWKDSWPDIVVLLRDCGEKLEEIDKWMSSGRRDRIPLEYLSFPVEKLADAINIAIYGSQVPAIDRWKSFSESWISPDNLDHILRFGATEFEVPTKDAALLGVLHEHSQVVSQLLRLPQDLVKGEGIVRLMGRSLTADEFNLLHTLRLQFLSQAYRDVIERATEILETRIRDDVYPAMRAVWGEDTFKRLPPDVQKSVLGLPERGHPRARRGHDANFLYDVSRGQYSKVIFESTVYRALFDGLLDARQKERLKDTMELAFSLNDRTAHRDRASFFREHATEIGDVLQALPWVLEVFQSLCERFLSSGPFKFERKGETIDATFLIDSSLNPPPVSIHVAKGEAMDLSRFVMETCAVKEIQIPTLYAICSGSHTTPEKQLAIIRALQKRHIIDIKSERFAPLSICLAEEGRRVLEKPPWSQDLGGGQETGG